MIWRFFYNFLLYLLMPFVLLRLLWRSRRYPAYKNRWAERFGFFKFPKEFENAIWVHAVSVGETIAVIPLVQSLLAKNYRVVVTTMTPTGSERVKKLLGNAIFHVYVPYDLPGAVKRFLKKVKPRSLILMETELWPNILFYCHQNKIPVLLANARLSERSYKKYARFKYFASRMLRHINIIAAQTASDAKRFERLGVRSEKIKVTGNVKFDVTLPASLQESSEFLRQSLGADRSVWIAASTHEGEERKVLQAFDYVRNDFPDCLLILASRHPERSKHLLALCQKHHCQAVLRSSNKCCTANVNILIVDTMGELKLFYGASDVTFVGGSLIVHGGHNLIEPALFELPIITGPYLFNFSEISECLKEKNVLTIVDNAQALAQAVIRFLNNPDLRKQFGQQSKEVVMKNRGALEKHLTLINSL